MSDLKLWPIAHTGHWSTPNSLILQSTVQSSVCFPQRESRKLPGNHEARLASNKSFATGKLFHSSRAIRTMCLPGTLSFSLFFYFFFFIFSLTLQAYSSPCLTQLWPDVCEKRRGCPGLNSAGKKGAPKRPIRQFACFRQSDELEAHQWSMYNRLDSWIPLD